jgi:broad specificity phosphatase PhoE
MVTVWFIRHAESEANAGLPTRDPASIQITATGKQQAQSIAQFLPQTPSLIVTSPYLRTKQTAAPTVQRFPTARQAEWAIQEFTFLSPPRYCNTTSLQRHPMSQAYWQRCEPFFLDGEGAESFADLLQRVKHTRSQIRQLDPVDDPFVIAFSHGRFMRALLWSLLTSPTTINTQAMRQFYAFSQSLSVPNGTILKLQVSGEDLWVSGLHTAHMQQIALSDPQVRT